MSLVFPGQEISTSANELPGPGTFKRNESVFSTLKGTVVREGGVVTVVGPKSLAVPRVNDVVLGRVIRVSRQQATVSILSSSAQQEFQGIIRSQDIRQTNKDSARPFLLFRPGDIVRAKIISLGDTRSYYLTTASNELGVVYATSSTSKLPLVAKSWEEMEDPQTGAIESRKVAGPEPEAR